MNRNNVARAVHDSPSDADALLRKLDKIDAKIAAVQRRHWKRMAKLSARRNVIRRAFRWLHGHPLPMWAENHPTHPVARELIARRRAIEVEWS